MYHLYKFRFDFVSQMLYDSMYLVQLKQKIVTEIKLFDGLIGQYCRYLQEIIVRYYYLEK